MLRDGVGFSRVIICCGRVDLRKGISGLTAYVKLNYGLDTTEKGTLFLFCGNRTDRIKGLCFEGTGFLLLYKRLEDGAFVWPRSREEAAELTEQQYKALMTGLDPFPRMIREVQPGKIN